MEKIDESGKDPMIGNFLLPRLLLYYRTLSRREKRAFRRELPLIDDHEQMTAFLDMMKTAGPSIIKNLRKIRTSLKKLQNRIVVCLFL